MHQSWRRALLGYGLALLSNAAALGLTLSDPLIRGESPTALFLAAVMISSWWGGLGPGLLATLISMLAIDRYLIASSTHFQPDHGDAVRLTVFLGVALLINSLNASRRRLARSLRRRAAELAESDRRKDEFLAILGHELRGPLSPLRAAVEVLDLPATAPNAASEARGVIRRQVGQLSRLIDDLLDASRFAQGKIRLRMEPTALADVVDRAVETARPQLDERRHRLDIRMPADPAWIDGDAPRLAQALANLLDNAAKYTDPGGRIALVAAIEADEVLIRVHDDGIGMSPDALARAFDLFSQDPEARDRARGGLGIGLSLVRRIIAEHGGTAGADSPGPGLGCTFTLRVPARRLPPPPPAPAVELPEAGEPRDVLIVDDEPDAASMMSALLEAWGNRARVARDGPEAIESVRADRPDVILLDISLPGMDGFEVAARLRDSGVLGGTTLVALTGYVREDDPRFLGGLFDYHMVKPFDLDELRALILRAEVRRPAVLEADPGMVPATD